MLHALALVLLALAPSSPDDEADFIAAVEKSALVNNKKSPPRVERDEAGNVVRLWLEGLQLSPGEFRALGKITTLRSLGLRGTNTTSADLAHLSGMTDLEYLVLSNTAVTDEAVDQLARLPALRTICMGNVAITPAGIARLKEYFPKLTLGYSQRKK